MPRKRPLPLLGTIGLVHAVTLAVQQQWLQAPEVAEPLASEIRSSLKYEAATCIIEFGSLPIGSKPRRVAVRYRAGSKPAAPLKRKKLVSQTN